LGGVRSFRGDDRGGDESSGSDGGLFFFCLTTTAKEEHWLVMCLFRALALSLSVLKRVSQSLSHKKKGEKRR